MVPLIFLILSFLMSSITAFSTTYYKYLHVQQRSCATLDPDETLRGQHVHLHRNEPRDNHLWNSTMIESHIQTYHPLKRRTLTLSDLEDPYTLSKRQTPIEPLFTIDTYFHIVTDTSNSRPGTIGYVTDKMVSDQFAYLSNSYAGTGVAFNLVNVSRTVNDTWASNRDDTSMKTTLRQGTYSALNVYYQSLLQTNGERGTTIGDVLLGFCSLPTVGITPSTPSDQYITDGCNILSGTMPGSYLTDYNSGGTSVHEIGHWNGLLHPFQDFTCSASNWGDYVADTPQMDTYTNGCPAGKDTCPDSGVPAGAYDGTPGTENPYGPSGYAGLDPIHNFMDYSQDSCYQGFTSGQAARMVNFWVALRMGL